jgi:hypothetical protein
LKKVCLFRCTFFYSTVKASKLDTPVRAFTIESYHFFNKQVCLYWDLMKKVAYKKAPLMTGINRAFRIVFILFV